jgi:small subunit ribosomal protein S6
VRAYELIFIGDPELDQEALDALVERVQGIITANGGELIKVESMGRRRLAYPIKRRREGHYMLIHAGLDNAAIAELQRGLRLAEDVLRHMLVRLDEVSERGREIAAQGADVLAVAEGVVLTEVGVAGRASSVRMTSSRSTTKTCRCSIATSLRAGISCPGAKWEPAPSISACFPGPSSARAKSRCCPLLRSTGVAESAEPHEQESVESLRAADSMSGAIHRLCFSRG